MARTNEMRNVWFYSVDNDFSDKLIRGVAESNWPKVTNIGGILTLRNEAKKDRIMLSRHGILGEDFSPEVNGVVAHYIPVFLEDHRVEAMRAWSLHWLEGLQTEIDFRVP